MRLLAITTSQPEDVTWDYAPSGRDLIHGGAIPRPWDFADALGQDALTSNTPMVLSLLVNRSQSGWEFWGQ